jgi:hypothetical protein
LVNSIQPKSASGDEHIGTIFWSKQGKANNFNKKLESQHDKHIKLHQACSQRQKENMGNNQNT